MTLTGPVELRVRAPARFEEVRIAGDAVAGQAPALVLDHVPDGRAVIVGSAERPFAGAVTVARTALVDSQLVAEAVAFESVTLNHGRIETHALVAVDAELVNVAMVLGEARFAAAALRRVHVAECDALSLFGVTSRDGRYPACRGDKTRIYNSVVMGGSIDGDVQGDDSRIGRVQLGLHEPTQLWMWSGTFRENAVCERTETAAFSLTLLTCNECTQAGALVPTEFCALVQNDTAYRNNFCVPLEEAPPCERLPPRERPEMTER